jgi:hypothetical protein
MDRELASGVGVATPLVRGKAGKRLNTAEKFKGAVAEGVAF